jgi:hypothetical protein
VAVTGAVLMTTGPPTSPCKWLNILFYCRPLKKSVNRNVQERDLLTSHEYAVVELTQTVPSETYLPMSLSALHSELDTIPTLACSRLLLGVLITGIKNKLRMLHYNQSIWRFVIYQVLPILK